MVVSIWHVHLGNPLGHHLAISNPFTQRKWWGGLKIVSLYKVSSHARRQPFDHLQSQLIMLISLRQLKGNNTSIVWKTYVLTGELPSHGTCVTVSCCERTVYMKKAWAYNIIVGHWQEFLFWSSVSFFFPKGTEALNSELLQFCIWIQKYPILHFMNGRDRRLDVWKLEWHCTCLGIHWCIICWYSPFLPSVLSSDHQP
jgi:hypothetical protein